MKKITLLILFGFFWSWASFAQVPIGPQDGNTANMPISSCYNFSYSQQIIYQEEINAVPGDITSISFFYDSSSTNSTANSSNWTIYVGHTVKDRFATNGNWEPLANLTQVFSGTVTYPGVGNFMLITFDTPFPYNNVDNLIVAVDENSPGSNCTLNFGKTPNLGAPRSIYYRSETVNPDPTSPPLASGRANYINNMILGGIQESCPAPSNLAVNAVADVTASVSWTENGTATEWEVLYGPAGFNPATAGTVLVDDDGTPGITITGLTENTNYEFYITSICAVDDRSARIGPMAFRTTCGVAALPYLLDFEDAVVPNLPLCTSREKFGNGNDWVTATYTSGGFTGKVLKYGYNSSNAANAWFYTQGMELEAGEFYQISYDYGNNSTSYTEKMKVSFGMAPMAAAMTTLIADHPNIRHPALEVTHTFTVPADGIYYFGFNAYSPANLLNLYVDNINVFVAPTCIAPSDLTVNSVGETTAEISWTEAAATTEWEVTYGLAGFNPLTAGTTIVVNNIPQASLTGLSSSTQYDFYVRAICSDTDESALTGPFSFRTTCGAISVLPYLENFDTYGTGSNAFPACWERPVTYTSGTTWPSIVSANSTSSPNSLRFQSAVGIPTYAVSPPFAEDINNLRVTFMLKREGTSSGTIDVGVMSNPTDISTFELVHTINPTDNNHHEYTFNLNQTTLSGPGNFIALRHNSTSSIWYYWLDDFVVDLVPSCIEPLGLAVNTVTETTADVSWTEAATATQWEVTHGLAGFNPLTAGTTVVVNNTPQTTITGLSSSTQYDFYVRAICSDTDESTLVGPFSFRTACGPVSVLPYIENFDTYGTGSDAFPACWERPVTYTSGTVWPSIVSANSTSSPNSLRFQSAVGIPTYAVSPTFTEDINNLRVSFMLKREGTSSGTIDVGVMSNANDISTFELVHTINPTDNNHHEYIFNLNQTTLSGPGNFIALRHNSNSSIWYYWLDDFVVDLVPSCIEPSDLTVGTVTETTADVSWTEAADATQWEVTYGSAGFNPLTGGTTVVVNNTPQTTLTGLISDRAYEFYVRAICSDDDESYLSGPKYFFTGYCSFTSTSTSYFITDFYTEEGTLNISNLNSGQSPNGYGNFTHMAVVSYPTSSFNFNAQFNGTSTYGFNMWIDFNGNMEFEDSEKVYASGGYVSSASGTIQIPMTVPNGNYRMRIVANWLSTNPNPCGANTNSEAEDYTVTIINAPTCFPPTNLTLVSANIDSATVSWVSQDRETVWNVIYGPAGFDPETGGTTLVVENTPEATITGLTSNTRYDVYVQAVCEVDDLSFITGPLSFYTNCTNTTVPYLQDFESAIVPELPNCTSGEKFGNGNMWETLYYNSNGFRGKVLKYGNAVSAANAWFYTQGIEMFAGVEYRISYKFGNVSTTWTEKMKVAFGTGTGVGAMTTVLADYPNISQGAAMIESVTFTVPEDGVYYFGFNVYSNGNQFNLYLDDINVNFEDECDAVTGVEVVDVTNTSVTVSWNESATATDGYVVDVFLAGANPSTDAPEASETVAAGVTFVTVDGLTNDTAYDVYVTADCGFGNVTISQGETFNTTELGVNNNDYTQISYFPNPVKGQLTITAADSIDNVTVYNILGQTIMEVKPNGREVVLDMTALPSGTYILKANVANGISTFKILKE